MKRYYAVPNTRFKKGQIFGQWQLKQFINAGGNGEVWQASHVKDSSRIVAIKLLKRINEEGYKRFIDEVKVVIGNRDIEGLLNIIDYDLPKNPKGVTPWYTMPLATPLMDNLKDKSAEEIVDIVIKISCILSELHRRGISHRDIKPANILIESNTIFLGDFGLVEYPEKQDITPSRKDLGPRWTIAPEMRRNPDTADGKAADVYSIAKTLWILLTKQEQSFEGQYSVGSSIELRKYVPAIYHAPLDDLLHRCTDHEPIKRPNIIEFADGLSKWKELNKDFERRSKSEWIDIRNILFPYALPRMVIWHNINDIIAVLNIISEHGLVNHTLLPGGGGLDLTGTKLSYEKDCIELLLNGFPYIIKPLRLIFECFEGQSDWNYFRLETGGLVLLSHGDSTRIDEGLTEIEPGVYSDYECIEYDDFDGERLPASARSVIRVACGSFLVCLRTGIYNSIPGTYDGRHNRMNAEKFREYIEKGIEAAIRLQEASTHKDNTATSLSRAVKYVKSAKIRKGARALYRTEIQLIEKVIKLFKYAKDEEKQLYQKYGLAGRHINFFDEKTIKARRRYDKASKPRRKSFDNYLSSLSDDQLAIVEAVMYGGRDAFSRGRAYPLDEMLRDLEKDSRDSRIYSISGKAPLDKYLLAGMKAYK